MFHAVSRVLFAVGISYLPLLPLHALSRLLDAGEQVGRDRATIPRLGSALLKIARATGSIPLLLIASAALAEAKIRSVS